MSFILIPKHGEEVEINAWNWRPTLALLRHANLIDGELYERMGIHGAGASLGVDATNRIADFLDARLAVMKKGERIRADLTTSDAPKKQVILKPGMRADEVDAVDLYSATYEWLARFRDFCRTCGGFRIS